MLFNLFKKKSKQKFDDFSWIGVDIHSHLIPGIDDGAKDLEDSIQLIRGLRSLGFSSLVTTPHVMMEYYPNTTETIQAGLATLSNPGILHAAAAEYFLDDHFERLIEKDDLLNIGDNHVLFELSFFEPPPNLRKVIFDLQMKGYQPILAHPERYLYFTQNISQLEEIKTAGCQLQLNLLSVTGHYGKPVQTLAEKLLDKQWYDFAGTDTHHLGHLDLLRKGLDKSAFSALNDYPFKNAIFAAN